jgi:hypothetical protein
VVHNLPPGGGRRREIERVYNRRATVLTMGVPSALVQPVNVAPPGGFSSPWVR